MINKNILGRGCDIYGIIGQLRYNLDDQQYKKVPWSDTFDIIYILGWSRYD
jgi:hypothetical protein